MKQLEHNNAIRNVAIIAHVDHGKTTLIDQLFRHSGALSARASDSDRVMDSMDLERERGITIAAKNCAVRWGDAKVNILDTPGHADFGGEVERALMMVDGAILLVDASEGPLPQTRFVLKKALERQLRMIVVINKIDRSDARPQEVLNEVYDLFIDLDATEDQLEFPVLYAIGREGIAKRSLEGPDGDFSLLFDTIISEIPGPLFDPTEPFQMLVTNLSYSEYLGRLTVGRVMHGRAKQQDALVCIDESGEQKPLRVVKLQVYDGMGYGETTEASPGDIIILAGVDHAKIGDTIATKERPKALKRIAVDEPTISMRVSANTSPFSGREGKFVQSTRILERLQKETLHNVALKLEEQEDRESFVIKGRGEFQMAILVETMRREGFELSIGRPQTIMKEQDGKLLEPIEHLFVDCDEQFLGVVTEKLSFRKGRMVNMVNHGTGRVRIEFSIPARGLIGYRSEFLTDTRGTGILNAFFEGYEEHRGEIRSRLTGSLVADREGEGVAYALFHLEPRGTLFITPNEKVYEGMIVGEHNRDNDLNVNVCKTKKLSNMRAAGKDDNILLTPVLPMTLERAMEFIKDDELVEVTPKNIRLRKKILRANQRS
ncbi:MAG: translational GTPase TypA [Bdellovibrionales bacterium]|nr:translational GTPase TypA [Bdellovibrionales bacterium]